MIKFQPRRREMLGAKSRHTSDSISLVESLHLLYCIDCKPMSLPAIRFIPSTTKALGAIYLQCHVKPGASKAREGIISVGEDVIEVCVSARAKEGEANKAVRDLFSSVCFMLFIIHSFFFVFCFIYVSSDFLNRC